MSFNLLKLEPDDDWTEEEKLQYKKLITRLKKLSVDDVSLIDEPAVNKALWRLMKADGERQLEIDGITPPVSITESDSSSGNIISDEDGERVTPGQEKNQDQEKDVSVSDMLSGISQRVDSKMDEMTSILEEVQSQVEVNTESISTLSHNENPSEVEESTSVTSDESSSEQSDTSVNESVITEDEYAVVMDEIMDTAKVLESTATENRELKQSSQISQEQYEERMKTITDGFNQLQQHAEYVSNLREVA